MIRGVDPRTGELLGDEGPLQDPYVIRALFTAVEALEERRETAAPKKNAPPKAGLAWSPEDHELLMAAWREGGDIDGLAKRLGRSPLAVTSRLVKYGQLPADAIQGQIPNAPPRPFVDPNTRTT